MARRLGAIAYFSGWFVLAMGVITLNILNQDWDSSSPVMAWIIIVILAILECNVLELVVMAIAAMVIKVKPQKILKTARWQHLTLLMNYNLLALSEQDVEETMETMYNAYMANLGPNVSAVLVSATKISSLKEYEIRMRDNYRALITDTLREEGRRFSDGHWDMVNKGRLNRIWRRYAQTDTQVFMREYLPEICNFYSREFMTVQRVSKVLKKCGQYQDLMLLSEGDNSAFTYTDRNYYADLARPYGEPLFYESVDVDNIKGRKFDYTLVLDGDTQVLPGTVADLMGIAAAHPKKGIIQPGIKLHAKEKDSMFMHVEALRQEVNEPYCRVMSDILGQAGFYGKALLKNKIYIKKVLGTRDKPIERVPIDVLSHDTFEAGILKPMYAPHVFLIESPCYNYISWDAREARWSKGEIILAMYFWRIVGVIMRLLQKCFQGDKARSPRLRTSTPLDFITAYISYSPLRQMFMKPCLLLFILIHINVHLYYYWVPFASVVFFVCIFPKFAVITCYNWKAVLIEMVTSVIQFTPEAVVGTYRVFKSIEANTCCCCPAWKPQRALEEELKKTNPFRTSFRYLWYYMVIAAISILLIIPFFNQFYMFFLPSSIFTLPFYCGFTSFNKDLRSLYSYEPKEPEKLAEVKSHKNKKRTERSRARRSSSSSGYDTEHCGRPVHKSPHKALIQRDIYPRRTIETRNIYLSGDWNRLEAVV